MDLVGRGASGVRRDPRLDPLERELRLLQSGLGSRPLLPEADIGPASASMDPLLLRGLCFALVTAVGQACEMAQLCCAATGWGPPRDDVDAVRLLAANGVLQPHQADEIAHLVRFRHGLLYRRADLDVEELAAALSTVHTLREMSAVLPLIDSALGRPSNDTNT